MTSQKIGAGLAKRGIFGVAPWTVGIKNKSVGCTQRGAMDWRFLGSPSF